ncbi:MAG: STAS domain-containing protein [Mycobacterium sp.]
MPDSETAVPASKFAVEHRILGDVTVLTVHSALDMLSTPVLTKAVDAAMDQSPAALIIDLTEVDFLASVGMSALVDAHQKYDDNIPLLVVADGPATGRPMKLLGLDTVLRMYPSLDTALHQIQ